MGGLTENADSAAELAFGKIEARANLLFCAPPSNNSTHLYLQVISETFEHDWCIFKAFFFTTNLSNFIFSHDTKDRWMSKSRLSCNNH